VNRLLTWALVLVALPLVAAVARAESTSDSCVADHRTVQTKRQSGDYLLAREAASRCADARCPQLVREDCAPWYVELEDRLPSLIFETHDVRGRDLGDVRITANGHAVTGLVHGRAVPVNPGTYTLRVEAQGYRPLERDLVVVEGVKRRTIVSVLEPIAPSAHTQHAPARRVLTPVVVTLGAIATVGLTTFAALGISGKLMFQRLEQSHCKPDCSLTEVEHANRTYKAADIAAAVGGAAAIACGIAYLVGRPQPSQERRTRLDAAPVRGGATIALRATF
jgi:hypothetical protein